MNTTITQLLKYCYKKLVMETAKQKKTNQSVVGTFFFTSFCACWFACKWEQQAVRATFFKREQLDFPTVFCCRTLNKAEKSHPTNGSFPRPTQGGPEGSGQGSGVSCGGILTMSFVVAGSPGVQHGPGQTEETGILLLPACGRRWVSGGQRWGGPPSQCGWKQETKQRSGGGSITAFVIACVEAFHGAWAREFHLVWKS